MNKRTIVLFLFVFAFGGINTANSGDMSVLGGSVNIENPGEGKLLIYLGTERHWKLRQLGTGSSTALELASVGGNGNKNFVITTNGAVIIQPNGVGINSTLIVNGNLEVTGTITGKSKLPQPDYDSGWEWIPQGGDNTLTHNVGGNPEAYLVDLKFKDSVGPFGLHNAGYGGYIEDFKSYGAYWCNLTDTTIKLHRGTGDGVCNYGRVRIWRGE